MADISVAEKDLKVAVGALERCSREYQYYEDEKASLDDSVLRISVDLDLSADERAHKLKKTNEQIHETTTCLQDVGNNVQRFYEKIRALRDDLINMDLKMITRVNKAMATASVMLGETWDAVECEEKKMDIEDEKLEFQPGELCEHTVDVVWDWDPQKVSDYLKELGYDEAARKAVENEITGKLFLAMTRGTITTDLGITTSAERTKLLLQLDKIKGVLHTDFVYGLSLHQGNLLSCSNDGSVRSWTLNAGYLQCTGVLRLGNSITCMSVQGNLMACVVDKGLVDQLWLIDLTGLKVVHKIEGFNKKVVCVETSNDGKFVATGGEDGEVRVFGTQSGNEFAKLEGHRKKVMGLAWSPDDKQLAAASQDRIRQVRVWSVVDGKLMVKIKCKTLAYNVQWIACDKTERLVVGEQKAIGIYDVETGELVLSIPSSDPVWAAAVEPNSGRIAAGLASGSIIIHDNNGNEIARFTGHHSNIRALLFGEGYLFSASNDRSVRTWKLEEQ